MHELLLTGAMIGSFFMGFYTYRQGVQDGINAKDNKPFAPIIKPKPIVNGELNSVDEGLNNIFSYTGEVTNERTANRRMEAVSKGLGL